MANEKGNYRPIYSSIWDDQEFQSFDLNTKLVFFNLRTNRFGNFPCLYVCYHETIANQTGLSLRAVKKAFDTLSKAGWIEYQYPIVWVVKGLKNDPGWTPTNEKHVKAIENIIGSLPKLEIVAKFITYYSLKIPFRYPQDTPSIQGYQNQIPEPEKDTRYQNRKRKKEICRVRKKTSPTTPFSKT